MSLGSPRVGTIHVHAPTPHTPPLQAFLVDFSQQTGRLLRALGKSGTGAIGQALFASRALGEHEAAASTAYAGQALTHYQTYPERRPGADLPPKKACNLVPMAPRPRQKRQSPEGPQ